MSEGETVLKRGLSRDVALRRLVEFGPNALVAPPRPGPLKRLANQFTSALVYILVFALVLDTLLWVHEGAAGVPYESIAIALILALNASLGAYQEGKAEEALARLQAMAMPSVWVMRDNVLVQVPISDLVPGDIARIEAGDRVPADGTLTDGGGILADESLLTGESLPIEKEIGEELFGGTLIVRSQGYMEVTRTGPSSTMGRLASTLGSIEAGQTPLERRLRQFGNQIAVVILFLGVTLVAGGFVIEGASHIGQVVLFAVALAVAAVPEGLPAVLTLTLAMGVERLAKSKAIVRRLSAVEALGSVTVIATDKTGTLTENRMQVRVLEATDRARALHAMILANDAELETGAGDPLEVAMLRYAGDEGADRIAVRAAHRRVSVRPFDSVARFMAVTVENADGVHTYLKGAPEVIIARSNLSTCDKAAWEDRALDYAAQGYRVLALAWKPDTGEQDVVLLGLAMLWDPPRAEVPDALARAGRAGIRVIMLTGDHPATAKAVGEAIGITTSRVVTGAEIEGADPEGLRALVREIGIFARVAPEHKLRLVEALRANGEIVAVTGDGVNDAPALKRSDVGVAMGLRGSDVTREVADIVLQDDNFVTIVTAIEEGRSIYENIQKFIRFFFSTDLALIVLMTLGLGVAVLMGYRDPSSGTFFLPLTAVQLLWINVVADGPPALALAFDRNPGVMATPPRPADSRLLDAASLRFIAVSGLAKAAGGLALLIVLPGLDYGLDETRTTLFLYESLLQLVFAYPCRRVAVVPQPNLGLHAAVGLGVVLQFATILVPPLRDLLGLTPLDVGPLAAAVGLVLLTWAVAESLGHVAHNVSSGK